MDAERLLGRLVGAPLASVERDAGVLRLRFAAAPDGIALAVSCAWRVADTEHVLVASGDMFTPADPDADLETFDWSTPGGSWCDLRWRELLETRQTNPLVVAQVEPDVLGGLRLQLSDDITLELFADSSAAPHVESEYWRLVPDAPDSPSLVVSSGGAELVTAE